MRRIAIKAMGPVVVAVSAACLASPAHSVVALPRSSGPQHHTQAGFNHVTVSWRWHKTARHYEVQVAGDKTFADTVAVRTKRSDSTRPPGGRQLALIGHLSDASYYWTRVRQVGAHGTGHWGPVRRVATRASFPDPITGVTNTAGPGPGETTISWTSAGKNTDYFRIETALTPFSKTNPGVSATGWHPDVFKVDGNQRSLTLTPQQTADAGAGLGTGRHLLFRIYAVRDGQADKQLRGYAHIQDATIAGQAAQETGSSIRAASYNVRLGALDRRGPHAWKDRAVLLAKNIGDEHPDIVALQELVPTMWDGRDGGPGLGGALKQTGLGYYDLNRTTKYANGLVGDARILYNSNTLQLLSSCDPDHPSCGFVFPDVSGRKSVAQYAQFQDRASGERFWFVSAHLAHGNTADVDALRGREVKTILAQLAAKNTDNLPVIFGGDLNSYQTCPGHNAPHQAFLDAGWYDTSAAATQIGMKYNTVNDFDTPQQPSNNGFGARLDVIMTQGMPGADLFENVLTGAPYPSDHNMVIADLKLPAS